LRKEKVVRKYMKKNLIVVIIAIMLISAAFMPIVMAAKVDKNKGAVAMWEMPNRSENGNTNIYALLTESNNGQDGILHITVVHNSLGRTSTSEAVTEFEWNMDHITVTVPVMKFPWGTPPATRDHYSITITFEALPKSVGVAPSGDISIDGSWKQANAVLIIDDPSGAHAYSSYPTSNAYIFHGIATITP
jgi:hypothetical protein